MTDDGGGAGGRGSCRLPRIGSVSAVGWLYERLGAPLVRAGSGLSHFLG
jgi:hypothetical protein